MITRLKRILESLLNPSIDDAREFVYRDYQKAKSKYTEKGDYATKIPLLPIIQKVTKKFNSYGSEFTVEDLIKYYVESQLSLTSGNKARIESEMSYFGIDTLPDKYIPSINEAKQVGLLYHFTSLPSLENILKTGILKARLSSDDAQLSISFTRDKNFSNTFRGKDFVEARLASALVLDGDKLANKYKIKPVDFAPAYDEMEERINGVPQILIKDYLKEVLITSKLKKKGTKPYSIMDKNGRYRHLTYEQYIEYLKSFGYPIREI